MTTLAIDGERSQLIYELRSVLSRAEVLLDQLTDAGVAREAHPTAGPEELSERELDVLRLVARGWSNKQIARDLTIAENTVKTHVSTILGKLGVQSRTQAALYAERIGLVSLDSWSAPIPGL
jgi:DNA-binding NarL/FixJ family response regulator